MRVLDVGCDVDGDEHALSLAEHWREELKLDNASVLHTAPEAEFRERASWRA